MAIHRFPSSWRISGAIAVCSVVGVACSRSAPQMMAPPAVPVQVQALQAEPLAESSEFIGALEAEQRVILRPEVAGRISQLFVAAGAAVNPGQPVVQLRPDQAQAQVAGAAAGAQAAQFGQQAAQAQIDAAQAQVDRANAEVQLAQVEFGRTERLASQGALSRQDLDEARNRLAVAQAAQRQATENLRAAQAQLAQAQATVNQAQAQVSVNQESLGFTQVTAPVAGIVGDVPVRVGDFVNAGQTITTIIQNQDLFLRIQVPTTRSNQLRLGLAVELIDSETGAPLGTGSIGFIAPEVDEAAQAVLVKARFPNGGGRLRDGQLVRARIIWNTTPSLLLPTVAVSRLAGQNFVFVAEDRPTEDGQTQVVASQRPVTLGTIQGNSYQVLDGLQSGDSVVITNILKLQDGVPIAPEAAPGSAPGSTSSSQAPAQTSQTQ
ncbi:MAG: efflux RND transporter periplasmic adaptor subunit [Spirulina sp.]